MGEVIAIHGKKRFSLEDARTVLPIVRRVTQTALAEVDRLNVRLSALPPGDRGDDVRNEVQERLEVVVADWQSKITKLGAEAKGVWLVDFDTGDGYYCWHYPEPDIHYFHGYAEGFRGRTKLPGLS